MDKFEYIQAVRAEMQHQTSAKSPRFAQACAELADQYVSIAESEGFPRGEFVEELLQRAYEARMASSSDPTFAELLEHSSLGPPYDRVMPIMPELLQRALRAAANR
ncbi:MAG TPA: hypothetical protein VFT59_04920 [Candidatus Saccharimonadales bacterium]|nr:hypothetical protein [Candidatus Saccharimonadales bacterium]